MSIEEIHESPEDVHWWFGLSYSSYLCCNRSLLQSMPDEWQARFVQCMTELRDHFPNIEEPQYTVYARSADGRFIKDPIPNYNRGRTFIASTDTYGA
jgi:hypothetical protein